MRYIFFSQQCDLITLSTGHLPRAWTRAGQEGFRASRVWGGGGQGQVCHALREQSLTPQAHVPTPHRVRVAWVQQEAVFKCLQSLGGGITLLDWSRYL